MKDFDVLLIQIPNPAFSISEISFCSFQPHCHLYDLDSSWGIFIRVSYLCVPLSLHLELTANATWGTRYRKYLHIAGKAGPGVCGLDLRLESVFILLALRLWRRQWHPTPVLLPGKSHGWRSLVDCSPWGWIESDTTEQLHFHFSLSCIGEGNGNPLQCSCLENPRDGRAWWAAIYGVAQSWTRLK